MAVKTFNIGAYATGWADIENGFTLNVYLYPDGTYRDTKSEWLTSLGSDDHYVIVKVQTGAVGYSVGGMTRCQGDGSTNTNYYFYITTAGTYLRRSVGGNESAVTSDTNTTYSVDTDYYLGMDITGDDYNVNTGTSDPPANQILTGTDSYGTTPDAGSYGGVFARTGGGTATGCRIYAGKGDIGTIPTGGAAVAPTSVLYGPLVGPMGGPI